MLSKLALMTVDVSNLFRTRVAILGRWITVLVNPSYHVDRSIHPQNPFLMAAMMSGACARSGLCN